MTVGTDAEDRRALGRCRPQRAPLTGGLPAGLVDVERRRAKDRRGQLLVRTTKRPRGAAADRIDRPDAEAQAKKLPGKLGHVAPRDAVSGAERHNRRLEP